MDCYDAIVIGLGGMGSATACHLSKRGARVLGIEQFAAAHARGSSHGQSRVIRQSYFEHPNYVPLLIRAYELWTELQASSGMDLMRLTGGLMIGRPESQTVLGSRQSAMLHRLPHEMLGADEIRKRFPAMNPSDDLVGLFEENAGFVRPEQCILAHLKGAENHGGELHFEEPVVEWTPSRNGQTVLVRTTQATYETASLVLAPGGWASRLFQWSIPLETVRQFLFWIEPTCDIRAFAMNHFPIFIWEADTEVQFYGFPQHGPATDGIKMAVFYNHEPCDPDELAKTPDAQSIQQIRDCLRNRIPSLNGPIVKSMACMYTNTPDHHFVLGKHPKYNRVTIASPCSGHGFKFCSVLGEILTDLALDENTTHPIEMFSPTRQALATNNDKLFGE